MDLSTIKKILIIRYRFVGDTVLSIPFVKNVKNFFPDAQIDVLVSPNSGELLEGNKDLNKVFYLDNTKFHKYENNKNPELRAENSEPRVFKSLFQCANSLKKENYDLAFVLKRSFSSAWLAFLAGIKNRIGFNTEFRSFLLTHSVKYRENIHEVDNFLECFKPLKLIPKKHFPEIFPNKSEEEKAKGFLIRINKFKPKILIHATSAHPYKRWPKRYFAEIMDFLYEEIGAQFVFTGAKIDKNVYEDILKLCKHKNQISNLNLCGLTSLRECYAIYKELDLAICVDSGNAHIAAAANIPTYVIYGPTNPTKWLPLGENVYPLMLDQHLPCQPCNVKVQCDHLSCMKLLLPNKIIEILGM